MINIFLITIAVTLFNHLGLANLLFGTKNHILNCPKCGTFWLVMIFCICNFYNLIECFSYAFTAAYTALWLELLLNLLNTYYNKWQSILNRKNQNI